MTFALAFWILMLIWLVFGLWNNWPLGPATYGTIGGSLLLFFIIAILGWHQFGAPIHQ